MTLDPETIIVVFGLNTEGRPHAARFALAELDIATRAAQLMNYKLVKLNTPDQLNLAAGLPSGRIYQTGKAFAPLTKQGVYDALAQLTPEDLPKVITEPPTAPEAETTKASSSTAGATAPSSQVTPAVASTSTLWDAINVGAKVLARDPGEDSWWEAEVVAVSEKGKMLTLRWKGYDDQPAFMAPRKEVALPFPS